MTAARFTFTDNPCDGARGHVHPSVTARHYGPSLPPWPNRAGPGHPAPLRSSQPDPPAGCSSAAPLAGVRPSPGRTVLAAGRALVPLLRSPAGIPLRCHRHNRPRGVRHHPPVGPEPERWPPSSSAGWVPPPADLVLQLRRLVVWDPTSSPPRSMVSPAPRRPAAPRTGRISSSAGFLRRGGSGRRAGRVKLSATLRFSRYRGGGGGGAAGSPAQIREPRSGASSETRRFDTESEGLGGRARPFPRLSAELTLRSAR